MIGVAHRHRSDPVLAGDPHRLVRGHPAGDQAEGVAGVEHPRRALPRPAELGVRPAAAAVELGEIGGEQADAVGVDAAQRGLEQAVDDVAGVLARRAPAGPGPRSSGAARVAAGTVLNAILDRSRTKRAKRPIPSAIRSSST